MDHARRNFLSGRPADSGRPLRPPGALPEARFVDACTTCGACTSACPEGIVVRGSGGFPELDFMRGECTFCGQCMQACEPQALRRDVEPSLAVHIEVSERCLLERRIVCQACGDACEAEAIRFQPRLGGMTEMHIDNASCTGCGACIAVCPEGAMRATAND